MRTIKLMALSSMAVFINHQASSESYDRICQYTSTDIPNQPSVVTEACSLKGAGSNEMPYFGTYKTRNRSFSVKRIGNYDFSSETHKAALNGQIGTLADNTSYNFRMKTTDGRIFNVYTTLNQDPKDTLFIGTWTLDLTQGCKRINGEYPDDTIVFSKDRISGYEHSCKINWHGRPLDNESGTLFVIADCQGEGEKWKEVYDFDFKSPSRAALKGMEYQKCPK